jgi:predicted Zn-dependent peptidase
LVLSIFAPDKKQGIVAYKVHILSNGIRVIHVPTDSCVCYCGLIINAGSRDELDDEHGMAHFIEHVVFKGTTKRKAFDILNRLDEVGGDLNAYTTKEETSIHAAFLSKYFERATELIADMVFNSTFPARELDKEKIVIADEIASYKDSPSESIFDEFEECFFNASSLGHNILGSVESISNFDESRVRAFMQRCYNTDEMVFSVYGNIKEDKVLRMAEKYFGHVRPNMRTFKRSFVKESVVSIHSNINKETYQGHVLLGGLAPSVFDEDKLCMSVLSNMLGGSCMNSRLSLLLRERNGIGYNVETNFMPFHDTGLFTIYYGTDSSNIERSLRIVNRELDKICSMKFSPTQLKKVIRQISGQLYMSSVSGESQMLSVGRSALFFDSVDDVDDIVRRLETITSDKLLEVAGRYIAPKSLSSMIYR